MVRVIRLHRADIYSVLINVRMIKIELQIDFVRILYKQPSKLPFSIVLSLHNEDGTPANQLTKAIPPAQDVVQLSSLPPFHLFMVVKQERETYSPFSMLFTTNAEITINRKLPLHKGLIYDHFQKIDTMAAPLDLVYTFHEGQLIYKVTVMKAAKVINDQEILRFENNFINRVEMYSTRESLPELDIEKQESSMFISKRESRVAREERRKNRSREAIEEEDRCQFDGLHYSKMTEETYLTLDEDFEDATSIAADRTIKQEMTYTPGFKAKVVKRSTFGQPIHQEQQLQKSISLKIKLVIFLLLIGALCLISSFIDEQPPVKQLPKSPKVSRESKPKREQRKRKVK